ncbi:MAG: Appr-1-p processing protein [Planctomycetota bacterium]|nr:MAG: Appr-1-p processing protein [Planctomycetota bacterium]
MEINYLKGDATSPKVLGNKIITHICNDIGGWGKGFVLAISKKWPEPELKYREWYKSKKNFNLGEAQLVQVDCDIWIANLIGQHKIYNTSGTPPIRYEAIGNCLNKVSDFSEKLDASVHMPRIGCGLAGGEWYEIEQIIKTQLIKNDIAVYVYDL